MKQDVASFLIAIQPMVKLSETEFKGGLEWLNQHYDNLYSYCKNPDGIEELYVSLKKNPDNWILGIAYCDICYEYKDKRRLNYILEDRTFKDTHTSSIMYINFRRNHNSLESTSSEDYLNKGIEAKHQGKYQEAHDFYLKALAIDDKNFEVHYALGKINFILGRYDSAIADYSYCIKDYISSMKHKGYIRGLSLEELIEDRSFQQLALHLGHVLVARKARSKNIPKYIELSRIYRETIDPCYTRPNNHLHFSNDQYKEYETNCLAAGFEYIDKNVIMPIERKNDNCSSNNSSAKINSSAASQVNNAKNSGCLLYMLIISTPLLSIGGYLANRFFS